MERQTVTRTLLLTFFLVALVAGSAHAVTTGTPPGLAAIEIWAFQPSEQPQSPNVDLSIDIDPKTGEFSGGPLTYEFPESFDGTSVTNVLTIRDFGGNVDPSASITVGFTDMGAPTSLIVTLFVPLSPSLNNPVTYSATLSGTLTDAAGAAGGVSASLLAPYLGIGFPQLFDATSTWQPLAWLGGSQAGAGPYVSGPLSASGTVSPGSAPYTMMSTGIAFTGSGEGDQYTFSTQLTVNQGQAPAPIPEPGTIALLGTGLAGLGLLRGRRRH